jgi:hypothetical protein
MAVILAWLDTGLAGFAVCAHDLGCRNPWVPTRLRHFFGFWSVVAAALRYRHLANNSDNNRHVLEFHFVRVEEPMLRSVASAFTPPADQV